MQMVSKMDNNLFFIFISSSFHKNCSVLSATKSTPCRRRRSPRHGVSAVTGMENKQTYSICLSVCLSVCLSDDTPYAHFVKPFFCDNDHIFQQIYNSRKPFRNQETPAHFQYIFPRVIGTTIVLPHIRTPRARLPDTRAETGLPFRLIVSCTLPLLLLYRVPDLVFTA